MLIADEFMYYKTSNNSKNQELAVLVLMMCRWVIIGESLVGESLVGELKLELIVHKN